MDTAESTWHQPVWRLGLARGRAGGPASAPVRLPPNGASLREVDFDRHVASLFGRLGCNAGSCHGSFQGRGGLNLSLFGHDPGHDYEAIVREAMGRRVDVIDPDRSLVLLKPTGQVPHEGGQRFAAGLVGVSRHPRLDRRRGPARPVARGGRADRDPPSGAEPRPARAIRPGSRSSPGFTDGTEADVTSFCDVHVKDDADRRGGPVGQPSAACGRAIRRSSPLTTACSPRRGVAVSIGPGRDRPRRARVRYHRPRGLRQAPQPGDRPSGPSSDAEFLRRVTLDAIGTLPTPEEVRSFLADRAPDKRAQKIDRLLAHPDARGALGHAVPRHHRLRCRRRWRAPTT